MKVIFWTSPLHILKAAAITATVPVEPTPVYGYQELQEEHQVMEDVVLATPAVNPEDFDWHWSAVRRHPIIDWTPSTFVVAGYRYPPKGTRKPGLDFERHPAKATVDHIGAAFGPELTAQIPARAYDLLSLMARPDEALTVVATLLEDFDPEVVVIRLADGKIPKETLNKEEALKVLKREAELAEFDLSLQEYADSVTVDGGTEVIGVEELNYVTDGPAKSKGAKRLEGKDAAVTTSPSVDGKGRVELDLSHVDWNEYRWADDLTGVIEPE